MTPWLHRLRPPRGAATRRAERGRQSGAALLTAMLTVTLVATFAAAALWQQWRAAEIESAERARVQAGWVLIGALDWSRLILREDARAATGGAGADHLAEPWAVPLEEAKLTTFLAADKNIASDALEGLPDAFLSGRIIDAQSKQNVTNLVRVLASHGPVARSDHGRRHPEGADRDRPRSERGRPVRRHWRAPLLGYGH